MSVFQITICEVTNPHEGFRKYVEASAELGRKHGGRYVVRGKPEEGADPVFDGKFLIVTEFPSEEALKAFKAEYNQESLLSLREGSGTYRSGVFKRASE